MDSQSSHADQPLPGKLADLISRFARDLHHLKQGDTEAQVRIEYINPALELLGWDVYRGLDRPMIEREVVHEDRTGTGEAPDYGVYLNSKCRFYVEAKRPSLDLANSKRPAFQVRNYAYHADLPLSLLTDFEEWVVYDCRVPPKPGDSARVALHFYCTYDELEQPSKNEPSLTNWQYLESLFSRQAVLNGSIERFKTSKAPRGTVPIDKKFLEDLKDWRKTLANAIFRGNPDISEDELKYAVHITLDRIIFLRLCEGRGIETYGQLQAMLNGRKVYERLCELFRRADEKYNSGLFHFAEERGRSEPPDKFTPELTVDDKSLKHIIAELYPPRSQYIFARIPAEVLGNAYEQFLGDTITIHGRSVRIEQKPEVRKAGGVYYTPSYIVEYIVEHTVGELLKKKTPKQVSKLRILDPACGSGSFLLGAFQYLLDWHLRHYLADDPVKLIKSKRSPIYRHELPADEALGDEQPNFDYRLTTAERKRILLNNIYGVDIDAQAVEVTKLSLLLKVLEGETMETLAWQRKLFRDRALPDLGENIKCGNSLIESDYLKAWKPGPERELERKRVRPFDWSDQFHEAFKSGGFDAVIGNPPYLSYSGRQAIDIPSRVREYYARRYTVEGWFTSHGLFIERASVLLSRRFVSFIVPDQVGHLDGYGHVRRIAAAHAPVRSVKYWGENVFEDAVTPALTLVADKVHDGEAEIVDVHDRSVTLTLRGHERWVGEVGRDFLDRLRSKSMSLGDLVADPGVHTGNCSKKLIRPTDDASATSVPVLEGKQIDRYLCRQPAKVLQLRYRAKDGEYFTIRKSDRYEGARFVIRQTAAFPIVGPRNHATYFRNSLLALYDPPSPLDVHYLVGLLNSGLLRYVYRSIVRESQQKAFPQVKVRSLRQLPIRTIDFGDRAERAKHDEVVTLVKHMLDLHKRLPAARTPQGRRSIEDEITATDRAIDRLVYDLYGLSDEEIAIVEEAAS